MRWIKSISFFFVIQETVAVAFEIRIFDLFPEFPADAFVVLTALQPARTISAGTNQPLLHGIYDILIFIESDFHVNLPKNKLAAALRPAYVF